MKKNDDMKPININALSKWKKLCQIYDYIFYFNIYLT